MKKIFIMFLFSVLLLNASDKAETDKSSDYYFNMASEKGQDLVTTFFQALDLLGKGVQENFAGAKDYFDKAYEQGNKSFNAWAQTVSKNLDGNVSSASKYIYSEGNESKEITKSEFDALLSSFNKAFDRAGYLEGQSKDGNKTADLHLANLFIQSPNPKDEVRARTYYEEALKSPNPNIKAQAYYQLGNIYFYGKAVIIDYKKALTYYEEAAKLNSAQAQAKLAFFYYNGIEVDKNMDKAKEYLKNSCQAGYVKACEFYNQTFVTQYKETFF